MQIASGMSPSFAAVPPRYAPNLPLLPSSAKLPVCILSFCRAQRFTYHIELKIATDRFYRKLWKSENWLISSTKFNFQILERGNWKLSDFFGLSSVFHRFLFKI
jgi:hypothetical protein